MLVKLAMANPARASPAGEVSRKQDYWCDSSGEAGIHVGITIQLCRRFEGASCELGVAPDRSNFPVGKC
jgi:hypothetical protein